MRARSPTTRAGSGPKLYSPPLRIVRPLAGLALGLGVWTLGSSPARAAELEAGECPAFAAVNPLALDECPVVFDAAPPLSVEDLWRELGLEQIVLQTYATELVYRGDLAEPTAITFVDVTLLGTDRRAECTDVALLEVAIDQPVESCTAGSYVIAAGASLGAHGRVVAILDGVVLLAWQGELRYLDTADADEPSWRMVWHPPWHLVRPHQATSTPPPRPNPRPGRRR